MKYYILLLLSTVSLTIHAQSIIGSWETYDDQTNEKKSVVEIYTINGEYFGKITELYKKDKDTVCEKCKGKNHEKRVIGLVIIENLTRNGKKFDGGTILDPESGDVYKCYLQLENDNKLKVRGFLGISVIGRTQYWLRKES